MMADPEEDSIYSISLRLQRITREEVFVIVPVTDAIIRDGSIDFDAFCKEAIKLGLTATWKLEASPEIQPHPIQMPPSDIKEN